MLTQQASSRYPGSDLLHGTGIDFFLPDLSTRMAVAAYHARPDTRTRRCTAQIPATRTR